jgi:hypothetical protein
VPCASSLPHLLVALACALGAIACTVDAPIAHRADVQPAYASKYFRVDAPSGPGWQAVVRTAEHPFFHERQLFTPWVPPRIGFILHEWRELWPHSLAPGPTIELSAEPAASFSSGALEPATIPGATQLGERELAGLRWSTFDSEPAPGFHLLEWRAADRGIEFTVTMRVADSTRGLPPPELVRVVAGLHREPSQLAAAEAVIERGIAALWRLASAWNWLGNAWSESDVATARIGIEALRRAHPERYEGPLFAAGFLLLEAEQEARPRSGTFEAVAPFDVASADAAGRVSTLAFTTSYDTGHVATLLREALARAPGSFWARYHLGIALVRAGDPEEGIRELTTLASNYPDCALAWFVLALARRETGDTKAALAAARRAASANREREVFSATSGLPGSTVVGELFGSTLIGMLIRELRR